MNKLNIFLSIIFVLAIIGTGIFFWKNQCKITDIIREKSDTTTWKTYIHPKTGFSVKYPSDWMKVTSSPQLITLINSDTYLKVAKLKNDDVGIGYYYWNDLSLTYYKDFSTLLESYADSGWEYTPNPESFDDLVKNNGIFFNNVSEKIIVDGLSAYYGELDYDLVKGPGIVLEHNGAIYFIELTNDKEIRDLIISSIKFLDRPDLLVSDFYNNIFGYLNKVSGTEDVSLSREYVTESLITKFDELKEKFPNGIPYNPFICVQNFSEDYDFNIKILSNNGSTAETEVSILNESLKVLLKNEKGWRIDEIICVDSSL